MRMLYPIENTLFVNQYQKRVFAFFLKKNWKLIKYVLPHLLYSLLHALHCISEVKYYELYWKYFATIQLREEEAALQQLVSLKKAKILDETGIYVAYAPKKFLDIFHFQIELITLDDLKEHKNVYEKLNECKILEYACVMFSDHKVVKKAKKVYVLRHGSLIELTPKVKFTRLLKVIGKIAVLSLVVTMASLALTPLDAYQFFAYLIQPLVIFLNYVPVFFLMLILFGLFNNLVGSFTLSSIIFVVLTEINRFKMSFRDDPFVFMDVKYAKEAAQMTNSYSLFIDKMTALIIVILLIVIFIIVKRQHEKLSNIVVRLSFVLVPVIAFFYLFHPLYLNTNLYNQMWNDMFGNQWKEGNQFIARGFTYSFLHSYSSATISAPDDYDEAYAQSILDQYETIDMEEHQKVNIIGIMLEAYNDFSVMSPEAEISEEVYQNFHKIQKESYSGYLYTDIFAGGTIATERSFLSGFSSLGEFRFPTDTYVSYLKNQGYYTEAMHPCYGWFYNRKNVNEVGFGFDSFQYYENKYSEMIESGEIEETFFGFLYDTDFFTQIAEGFEQNKQRNMPYFNFSVTYQNHGPYSSERLTETEYLKWDDRYNEEEYNIVNNYLADIHATDIALKQLYDYINAQEEPIVLVLFGDHNPLLGDENRGFELLGINLDLGTEEGGKNYYQTPYVITANQAAKEALQSDFVGEGDTISPLFLMDELLEVANLNVGTPYAQYLRDLKETIDVINPTYIKKMDTYVLRNQYEDDGTLKTFYDVQFLQQYGKGY